MYVYGSCVLTATRKTTALVVMIYLRYSAILFLYSSSVSESRLFSSSISISVLFRREIYQAPPPSKPLYLSSSLFSHPLSWFSLSSLTDKLRWVHLENEDIFFPGVGWATLGKLKSQVDLSADQYGLMNEGESSML